MPPITARRRSAAFGRIATLTRGTAPIDPGPRREQLDSSTDQRSIPAPARARPQRPGPANARPVRHEQRLHDHRRSVAGDTIVTKVLRLPDLDLTTANSITGHDRCRGVPCRCVWASPRRTQDFRASRLTILPSSRATHRQTHAIHEPTSHDPRFHEGYPATPPGSCHEPARPVRVSLVVPGGVSLTIAGLAPTVTRARSGARPPSGVGRRAACFGAAARTPLALIDPPCVHGLPHPGRRGASDVAPCTPRPFAGGMSPCAFGAAAASRPRSR